MSPLCTATLSLGRLAIENDTGANARSKSDGKACVCTLGLTHPSFAQCGGHGIILKSNRDGFATHLSPSLFELPSNRPTFPARKIGWVHKFPSKHIDWTSRGETPADTDIMSRQLRLKGDNLFANRLAESFLLVFDRVLSRVDLVEFLASARKSLTLGVEETGFNFSSPKINSYTVFHELRPGY